MPKVGSYAEVTDSHGRTASGEVVKASKGWADSPLDSDQGYFTVETKGGDRFTGRVDRDDSGK